MKLLRKVGATSEIWQVFIADSSSTTGAGLTGLVFNSASLTAYYHRDTDTTATAITLATMTVGTFTSSGFKEIDATNMAGWYQFCPPNAALETGAKSCGFHLKGATNMAPLPIEVDLDGQVDVTHLLGTAVSTPATAGILDVNVKNIDNDAASASGTVTFPNATLASTTNITSGTIATVTTVTNQLTAAAIATGVWQDTTAGDFTTALSIGKSVMNGVALGTGLTINAYTGNTAQTGDSYAIVNSGTHGNAAIKGYVDDIGTAGAGLTAVPWNAAWDAEVQSECTDALNAYDPPTNAEMEARTLVSASYATAANLATVATYIDTEIATLLTAVADVPTVAEFEARTLVSAGYASPTNITAGTITTVTNLTNAATSGDLTATMKTSVTTACTASTPTVSSVSGAVGSVTGNVGGNVTGSIGSLAAQAKADVNAEVLDVIAVDTTTQPAAVLSATPTIREILAWLGTLSRNKRTQTSALETLAADNGSTTIATSVKSDDGTTLTRSEWS